MGDFKLSAMTGRGLASVKIKAEITNNIRYLFLILVSIWVLKDISKTFLGLR